MTDTAATTTDRTVPTTDDDGPAEDGPSGNGTGERVAATSDAAGDSPAIDDGTHPLDDDSVVHYQTKPLLTPTLALMGTVVLLAVITIAYVWNDPATVGGPELAELVINGVLILAVLLLIRLGMTLLVLWRTQYTVHDEGFRTEYELAYHSRSRDIPVEEIRGQELERGRFETLFDCATIRLLSGGTDSSLGFVEFVHVPDPAVASERIEAVRRRHEVRAE